MDASLLVVSYNTAGLLEQCLRSAALHYPEAEVVVVDNASRDGSAAMVRREFPGVALVESGGNVGFAAANNLALRHSRGEAVVLLNSDTILEDDSLRRCVAYLEAHPGVGALSPRIVGVDGVDQPALHRVSTLSYELGVAARRPGPPPTGPGAGDDGLWWLAGTALVVRRRAAEGAWGLLDEGYWMYWEDADLSARLRRAGWELAYLPEAHVVHHGGASSGGPGGARPSLVAWYLYGRHRYYGKHRPRAERLGLWLLEASDVPRGYARGLLRPAGRPEHWGMAGGYAANLARVLLGRSPARPA